MLLNKNQFELTVEFAFKCIFYDETPYLQQLIAQSQFERDVSNIIEAITYLNDITDSYDDIKEIMIAANHCNVELCNIPGQWVEEVSDYAELWDYYSDEENIVIPDNAVIHAESSGKELVFNKVFSCHNNVFFSCK